MRLKVPFLGYLLAFIGLLLPPGVFVALLPSLVNTQPVRERLIAGLSEWTDGQVEVASAASVDGYFSLSVELKDVQITKLKSFSAVTSIKAQKIYAHVSSLDLLFGKLSFDNIKIHNALINVDAKDPREAAASVLAMLSGRKENPFASFVLSDSVVAMREGPGKPYRSLYVDSAQVSVEKPAKEIAAAGSLRWESEVLSFSARTGFTDGPDERVPLKMKLDGPFFSGQFEGLSTFAGTWQATGAISLRTTDINRFYAWLGYKAPVTTGNFAFKGNLDMTAGQVSLRTAEFALSGQSGSGSVSMKFASDAPRLEGVLAFQKLDLDRLLNPDQGAMQVLPLASMGNIDFRVSAEAVQWQGTQAGSAAFSLNAQPGRLSVEISELEFLDGTVRGHVEADTGQQPFRVQAQFSAESVNVAPLLALLQQRDWLSGKADVHAEADLQWTPGAGVNNASKARARVAFSDGGRMRLDIPGLADAAASGPLNGWGAKDFAGSSFDELRFALILQDERLRCDNLELQVNGSFVTGGAWFDLPKQMVDARLWFVPEGMKSERYAATATVVPMPGARVGLSINGPWANPEIRAEMSQTGDISNSLAKAAAALEVQEPER